MVLVMEHTPDRRPQTGSPMAPKKYLRRRAPSDIANILCKVKKRLVFTSSDETDSETTVNNDLEQTVIDQPDICVHVCGCTPGSRHLLSCQLVSINEFVSVAKCPLCATARNSTDNGTSRFVSEQSIESWSDENVIVSPFPGLKCYVATFEKMKSPILLETGESDYLSVYAPYDETFCRNKCCLRNEESGSVLIGKGSFGHVWKLPDKKTALKAAGDSIEETLLTLWISGVVRSRARDEGIVGELDDGVYCNILTATGSCLRHNVVSFPVFDRDLYTFRGWHFSGLSSYRRAFKGLADGYRFLNLKCGIAHLDVTPMNIIVQPDASDNRQILRAVICDFSLSQYHADKNGRCVIVFQETKTVRSLQTSAYFLTDMYHPAFKPLVLQKLCTISPRSQFPNPSSSRFCVSDLCALGNVLAFCLVRVFDERGQVKVRVTSEDSLFKIARRTCDALNRHDIEDVANCCSLLITRQLAYAVALLGLDEAQSAITRLCEFFATTTDEEAPDRFRAIYKRARHEIDGGYMVRLLQAALNTEDGRYLLENLRITCLAVDSDELDVDPYSIFP